MFVATLWIAVLSVAILQIIYGFIIFRHIRGIPAMHAEPGRDPGSSVPLTVIICGHNEASGLRAHLPAVLEQDYCLPDGSPAFEVIVVDDGSTDATPSILSELGAVYPHLHTVHIPAGSSRPFPGKKFPLSEGLAAATHSLIVCTDADCAPAGRRWLRHMAAPFGQGKEIVAGYGGYLQTGGMLNAFIRYETLHTFLQYYSFARAGLPYMAVGRNLAATKAAFLSAQQHPAWAKLPSGDDDLLIQLCATRNNMAVVTHPESFTWSAAKTGLGEYLAQKRRHVSTGKFYSLRTKLATGGYALLQAIWCLLPILCLVGGMPAPAYIVWALPMICHTIVLHEGAARMRERTSVPGWLLFFFCWVLYNSVLAPYILWKSKQRWK